MRYKKKTIGWATHNAPGASTTLPAENSTVPVTVRFCVVICKSPRRCKGHASVPVRAKFQLLPTDPRRKDSYIISGGVFCRECQALYVYRDRFNEMLAQGRPLCLRMPEEQWNQCRRGRADNANWMRNLREESQLHLFGYNVDANEGLTPQDRRFLLGLAMKVGIYTKGELRDFLTFLIDTSRNNPNKSYAVLKWEDDRRYLDHYETADARIVEIARILKPNDWT